jgi:two-component system catabolic regulation response regulator CreB
MILSEVVVFEEVFSQTSPTVVDESQMELSSAPTLARATPRRIANLQAATAFARPIQVLLIEDDSDAALLVEVYLTQDEVNPFRVQWVPNLFEAMNRLGEPGIDVVLLDLGLPELSGYRSYRVIEASAGGNVPIVILTSDDRSVSKDLTLGFGAAGYLLKDQNSPTQLRQALRNAILRFRPRPLEGSAG